MYTLTLGLTRDLLGGDVSIQLLITSESIQFKIFFKVALY